MEKIYNNKNANKKSTLEIKKGDEYYYIDESKELSNKRWEDDGLDHFRLEKGNAYHTKKEAQFVLNLYNFCKEKSFTPNWNNIFEEKFIIDLNTEEIKDCIYKCFEPFYYPNRRVVEEIINKYTFEDLRKYYRKLKSLHN